MQDTTDGANRLVQEILAQHPLDESVTRALMNIPRGAFVGDDSTVDANAACEDRLIPIPGSLGHVANLSQPSVVASMLEALEVRQGQRVLEIGAGSGYVAALLSELTEDDAHVTTLEVDPVLAEKARKNLGNLGKSSLDVLEADAFVRPSKLPNEKFDRVLFSASVTVPPEWIVRSLSNEGLMVFPLDLLVTRPGWPCFLARLRRHADTLEGGFLTGPVQGWESLSPAAISPGVDSYNLVQWDANETWHMLEYTQEGLTGRMAPTGLLTYLLGNVETAFQLRQINSLDDCRSWLKLSWGEIHREWLQRNSPGLDSFALCLTHSSLESHSDKQLVWMRGSGDQSMCLLL